MAARHIAIETWLEALDMTEYLQYFRAYNGVESLLYLSEADIKDMGIRNAAHRAKIVSSLRILRDKYERNTLPGRKNPAFQQVQQVQRSQSVTAQLSGSPPSLTNSSDYQQVPYVPTEQLQQDLLVELQGDSSDLKSQAWYHGSVSRQRAEAILTRNGDFVVRDCISQPGNFVLSCWWKGGPLHFVINSSVADQGPSKLPRVTYHFEDIFFNSVQDLIQYYLDECKPVTDISGAVITTPIGRSMPLSYYDSKYGCLNAITAMQQSSSNLYSNVSHPHAAATQPHPGHRTSPYSTPGSSPRTSPHGTPGVSPHATPGISPIASPKSGRKPRFVERAGSHPMLSVNNVPVYLPTTTIDRCDSLPMIPGNYNYKQGVAIRELPDNIPPMEGGIYKQATPTGASPNTLTAAVRPPTGHFHQRSGSAPVLTPGINVTQHFDLLVPPTGLNPASSDSDLHKAPPPKPSRIPSVKYKQKPQVVVRNKALYEDDSRDYSDYYQVREEPSWLINSSKQSSANENPEDKDYDNNTDSDNSQSNNMLHSTDVNQNLQKSDSRKISDTRFNILDGHDYSDIPAFPLVLNLKGRQVNVNNAEENQLDNNNKQSGNNSSDPTKLKSQNHVINTETCLNLTKFSSNLLPNDNKLLEPSVLMKVRESLLKADAVSVARHLTKVDLDLLKVANEDDLGVKVTSGLELITLPQGRQLRQDVLERIYCLQALVKVLTLTCPKVTDRAAMLSQWIQVAMETRGILGNLFGFENIMEALMSEQIERLRDTWMVLRQNHTSSAFLFDTKLKSSLRMLHDGSGSLPVQDVSIPSINPIVQLLERPVSDDSYLPWETADINDGLDTMLVHLDLARLITAQCGVYKVTGTSRIKDLATDQDMLEIFDTRFQLRFLWGTKGAGVNQTERHNKFDMLLTAYSEKIEKEGDDGTAV